MYKIYSMRMHEVPRLEVKQPSLRLLSDLEAVRIVILITTTKWPIPRDNNHPQPIDGPWEGHNHS